MNEQTVTPSSAAIRYGLIVGLICVIYSFILAMLDESMNRWLGAISYLFLIGGMVMAFKYYKEHNDGFMSFGKGLKIGTLMSLIVGLLTSVFMYIYIKFIDGSMMERIMEVQRAEMEAKGMDEAQIDRSMEIAAKFSTPEMIMVWGTVGFVIMGFIIALVVSGIMKHSRPEFE
jgi:glucan phosphoethanolaminetransferase (alkaline phosphatase superfamily)